MKINAPLLCLSLLLASPTLWASSSLRCDNGLASEGDSTSEVLEECGEPVSREFLGYRVIQSGSKQNNEVAIEEWSYAQKGGMYQFLRFEAGRLVSVTSKRKQ